MAEAVLAQRPVELGRERFARPEPLGSVQIDALPVGMLGGDASTPNKIAFGISFWARHDLATIKSSPAIEKAHLSGGLFVSDDFDYWTVSTTVWLLESLPAAAVIVIV